jgi:hypothetical protein
MGFEVDGQDETGVRAWGFVVVRAQTRLSTQITFLRGIPSTFPPLSKRMHQRHCVLGLVLRPLPHVRRACSMQQELGVMEESQEKREDGGGRKKKKR